MSEIVVEKYDMDHDKRGIALVINIRKYDAPNQHMERVWSVKDVENLKKTLNYLEFQVVLCQNLKKSELEQVMKEQAKLNYDKYDCFLCVVMSHGNDEKIATSDNKTISFDEIMAPIKECPTLIDKPKLFFFQACRGDNEMLNRQDSDESTSSGNNPTDDVSIISTTASSYSSNPKKRTFIKFEADLLVYYATKKHFYAFANNTNKGTIFIESVCEVFSEAYKGIPKNLSLSQMITSINKMVEEKEGGKQLTDLSLNFKKEVYFTPKNVSLNSNKLKKLSTGFLL
jgi:hypothetical protein